MNGFLKKLQSVDLANDNGSTTEQQNLIDLINHLSSDDNFEICASFIITELEKCSSQQQVMELQNSAAFFVCCRCIETFLKSSTPVTTPDVQKMSEFLRKLVKVYVSCLGGQIKANILKRKVSLSVCLAVIRYYPTSWSSVFDEILMLFSELGVQQINPPLSKSNPIILTLLEFYLEVLQELDSFIFNRQLVLTQEEIAKAGIIKDSMRITCLPSLIHMIILMVTNLQVNESRELQLICFCLEVIGLYVSWIDINLVVNTEFITTLESFVQCPEPKLQKSLCVLLKSVVSKGMAVFPEKFSLIFGLWPQLLEPLIKSSVISEALLGNSMTQAKTSDSNKENYDDILNLLQEFSNMYGIIGCNLTDSYRACALSTSSSSTTVDSAFSQPTSNWHAITDQCLEKLEASIDIAISLFAYPDTDVCNGVLIFISEYLGLLKKNISPLPPKSGVKSSPNDGKITTRERSKGSLEVNSIRLYKLQRLIEVLLEKMRYPEDAGAEEMEEFEEDRREYLTIIRCIARIDGSLLLNAIDSFFEHILLQLPVTAMRSLAVNGDILTRLEACLYLFYSVGEFYKAPKNDHFDSTYAYSTQMAGLMNKVCISNVSSITFFPVQLNFFEIVGRYDRFFNTSPKLLFEVLAAFLDERGLRNPNIKVRCRCAYLFSRLIKSHKSVLAPHAEQILRQLESLLPLDPTPESSSVSNCSNGAIKPTSLTNGDVRTNQRLFSITEQSFLYESAANLILACPARNGVDSMSSQLLAMLLQPILLQFPELVRLFAQEKNPELAEVQGIIVKQAADLITRTTRVISTQSPPPAEFVNIFLRILNIMVTSLTLLPNTPGSPGRASVRAGIRAFLHCLIGTIGPNCNIPVKTTDGSVVAEREVESQETISVDITTASNWLLLAMSTAVPRLIDVDPPDSASAENSDIRWRELHEIMPLFLQVAVRYKDRAMPFLTECLPTLIAASLGALAEPLHESQLLAMEERKSLRRGLLQLLQGIGQALPQGVVVALGSNTANILASVVSLTEACLEADDAGGMKCGLAFFVGCITNFGTDEAFYKEILLPHLLPLAFLSPARPVFRLTDALFSLALNEAAHCIHAINSAQGQVFQAFLQHDFLPQQNLSADYIELYINSLRTESLQGFQTFVKNFYSSFR